MLPPRTTPAALTDVPVALCVAGEAADRRSQVAVDRAVVRDQHASAGDGRVRQVAAG